MKKKLFVIVASFASISMLILQSLSNPTKQNESEIVNNLFNIDRATYEKNYLGGFTKTATGEMERFEKGNLILCFYFNGAKLNHFTSNKIKPTGIYDNDFKLVWVDGWKLFYFGSSYTVYKQPSPSGSGHVYHIFPLTK